MASVHFAIGDLVHVNGGKYEDKLASVKSKVGRDDECSVELIISRSLIAEKVVKYWNLSLLGSDCPDKCLRLPCSGRDCTCFANRGQEDHDSLYVFTGRHAVFTGVVVKDYNSSIYVLKLLDIPEEV